MQMKIAAQGVGGLKPIAPVRTLTVRNPVGLRHIAGIFDQLRIVELVSPYPAAWSPQKGVAGQHRLAVS